MQEIIDARMPIRRYHGAYRGGHCPVPGEGRCGEGETAQDFGFIYTTYYKIGEYVDYYYGTLLTNTSQLYLFGLEKYYDGMLLRIPSLKNPDELGEMTRQDKMFEIFKEHHRWQDILGIRTVGDFNQAVRCGSCYRHHQYQRGAAGEEDGQDCRGDSQHAGVKLVLLAGPSSSGKTYFRASV